MIRRKTQTLQFNNEDIESYWEHEQEDQSVNLPAEDEQYPASGESEAADEYDAGHPEASEDQAIADEGAPEDEMTAVESPFVYYDNEKHSSSRQIMSNDEGREMSADQFDYAEIERKAQEQGQEAFPILPDDAEREHKNKEKRQEKRRKKIARRLKRKRINPVAVVLALILLVGGFAAMRNIIVLQLEHHRLMQENQELTERRDSLKIELKNVNSKEYIEQQARRQLRLVNPDEILFVFDDGKDDEEKS